MIPAITVMKTMGTITAATGNPGPKGAIKVMIYVKLLPKYKKEKMTLMKFFVSYSHQMDIFPKSCSNIMVSNICGLSLKSRHSPMRLLLEYSCYPPTLAMLFMIIFGKKYCRSSQ